MTILDHLLQAPLARGPYESLNAWLATLTHCPYEGSALALWGGYHADRVAYAFAAGYIAALERLLDPHGKSPRKLRSLCATEAGGAHPRSVTTRLIPTTDGYVLYGEKTFATLANVAEELFVVTTMGQGEDFKNQLRLVRVIPNARGVEILAKPPLPIAPELPHAIVRMIDVQIAREDVLPGDAYADYVKPFRTVEDIHVLASTVSYLLGASRAFHFDRSITAELASFGAALLDISARNPTEPSTHILLAGLFAGVHRLLASLGPQWSRAPEAERARWYRDEPLLNVAGVVRERRTEIAWKAVGA